MTAITLSLIALVLYVWHLAGKISKLEKRIDDFKKKKSAPETPADEQARTGRQTNETGEEVRPFFSSGKTATAGLPDNSIAPENPPPAGINGISFAGNANQPEKEPSEERRKDFFQPEKNGFNWEIFAGIKLFAWIGGFAAFLGIIFFTKYAVDNNLISPSIRIFAGFAVGIVLVCAGIFTKSDKLKTTGNVLSAVGIIFIYVSAFAAGSIFNIFSIPLTFIVMTAASALAFVISAHKNAKYIAVLASAGGYLTPVLLSSGSAAIISLAVYTGLLTVTIMMIAVKKEWGFLVWLSCAGVYLILCILCLKDFVSLKTYDMFMIFSGFAMLFCAFSLTVIKKYGFASLSFKLAPFLFNIFSMFFVFMFFNEADYLAPALLGIINACLLLGALNDKVLKTGYAAVSAFCLLILFLWTGFCLEQSSLRAALGAYLAFFALNCVLPFFAAFKNKEKPSFWNGFFAAALLPALSVCSVKLYFLHFDFWIIVILAAFFALFFADTAKNVFIGLLGVFGIFINFFIRILSARSYIFDEFGFCAAACGFAFGVLILAFIFAKKGAEITRFFNARPSADPVRPLYGVYNTFFLSCFMLLISAMIKVKPAAPELFIISGLAISLFALFLSLINETKNFTGFLLSLSAMFFMQSVWQVFYYKEEFFPVTVFWYFIVFIFFFGAVFLSRKYIMQRKMPWLAAALAGVFQCFLIYFAAGNNPYMAGRLGMIPAAFAVIYALSVLYILKSAKAGDKFGKSGIGILSAAALFFITSVFPMQFKTQWLLIALALEAAALTGLFRLIDYKPLKYWAFWLFILLFLRTVFPNSHLFTVTPGSLLNSYLYVYSVSVISMFAGALLWTPKEERYAGFNYRNILLVMAVILLFVLVNTEIGAFFAAGKYIHFSFNNSFAQDMVYTLSWGVFAIGMFVFGIAKKIKTLRLSALVLLSAATLKLFLHDLWSLGQLYRIGSFFGLAAMLILVSFLYQKYVAKSGGKERP